MSCHRWARRCAGIGCRHFWIGLIAAWVGCLVVLGGAAAVAAEGAPGPGDEVLFQAHLQAGEFAPARAVALRTADVNERDRRLGEIAAAQAAIGGRRASLRTLARVADDRSRGTAVERIGAQPVQSWPTRGGGVEPDFDSLIELITSTIAPQSWDEVGGPGAIDGFDGGVYVDSRGVLKKLSLDDGGRNLAVVHALAVRSAGKQDIRRKSPLRKVSLTRLEKQVQLRWAIGQGPSDAMKMLAGLTGVKYVLVYPDSGDIVLAGPAEGWTLDPEGRRVGVHSGKPVLQLDDLVVVLRNALTERGRFGCSITPTKEGLARTRAFLKESSGKPLKPYQRDGWLADLRDRLGKQDIVVYGVDPRTRVARVLVEADYRMKLVGMGLEEGTLDVTSYLDRVKVAPDGTVPPMEVLRWWFTLNYDALQATKARDAFELRGQGVKLLSENEMITERGERVHTGTSGELNREFARGFTRHFPSLAAKYPIYAELRNVFDLALVAALIQAEDLPGRVGWHLTHFADPAKYRVQTSFAPARVDSVINYRLVERKHIIAGVSGGVSVDTSSLVRPAAIRSDDYGLIEVDRKAATPRELPDDAWWWD